MTKRRPRLCNATDEVAATYIPLALVVAVMSHYFKERLLIALKIVFLYLGLPWVGFRKSRVVSVELIL